MSDDLPTPRSIAQAGFRVHVWCKSCHHAQDADLEGLVAGGRGDVPLVRMRWRCGNCGSRLTDSVVTGSHFNGRSDHQAG
jgi:hypothetical protein